MPFGFSEYLRQDGKSEATIQDYQTVVNQLFAFLDHELKSELEVYEIQGRHLQSFIRVKKRNCSNSTINKNISILKVFFDYLWESKQIPIDPMSKIKYVEYKVNEPQFEYQDLLDTKLDVMNNSNLRLLEKVLYVLSLKGITYAELGFKKEDVIVEDQFITITVTGKNEQQRVIELQNEDVDLFYTYFERTLFLDTPYVFISEIKKRGSNPVYIKMRYDRIRESFIQLREEYEELNGLNLTTARNAYIYHLVDEHGYTLDDLQDVLGFSRSNVGKAMDSIIKRYETL